MKGSHSPHHRMTPDNTTAKQAIPTEAISLYRLVTAWLLVTYSAWLALDAVSGNNAVIFMPVCAAHAIMMTRRERGVPVSWRHLIAVLAIIVVTIVLVIVFREDRLLDSGDQDAEIRRNRTSLAIVLPIWALCCGSFYVRYRRSQKGVPSTKELHEMPL